MSSNLILKMNSDYNGGEHSRSSLSEGDVLVVLVLPPYLKGTEPFINREAVG
jgi:hypothetical protein